MNENQNTQEVVEKNGVDVDAQPQQQQEKTFTYTQSELDKMFETRLARQEKRLNAEFEKRLNELSDAQKLAQMGEKEKAEFEFNKRLQDLEARERALQEKEDAYNKAQYKQEIQRQLDEAGLPDISDSLIHLEAEVVKSQIDAMKQAFDAKVNSSIESKLKQTTTPQESTKQAKQLLTREQIEAMSPQEYRANRDLVNESLKALRGQN